MRVQYNTFIVIVGAGPAGLTLACLLKKMNVPFIIIDKKSTISPIIKACMLSSRSLEIFSDLGLLNRAQQLAQKIDGLTVFRDQEQAVSLEYKTIPARFQFNLHLGQPYTEKILLNHLQGQGISVLWEHELQHFTQDQHGVHAVIFHREKEINITAQYMIGADGASSLTRQLCRLAFVGETYPNYFLLANAKLTWDRPRHVAHVFFQEKGFFTVSPVPDGSTQLGGNLPATVDITKTPSASELIQLFNQRSVFPGKIEDITWIGYHRTHCRYVQQRILNRVILIGDAAQIISPLTGLGMNAGIQDAENVAWKLKLIFQHIAKSALLSSYAEERYWLARKLASFSNVLEEIFSVGTDRGQSLRDYMWTHSVLNHSVQQREVSRLMQKDLNYRNCTLFSGVTSGVQAPDPLISSFDQPMHLFDLLDHTKHHLLVFANDIPRWIKAVLCDKKLLSWMEIIFITTKTVTLPARMIYDQYNDVYSAFSVNDATCCLIRPDRYISCQWSMGVSSGLFYGSPWSEV